MSGTLGGQSTGYARKSLRVEGIIGPGRARGSRNPDEFPGRRHPNRARSPGRGKNRMKSGPGVGTLRCRSCRLKQRHVPRRGSRRAPSGQTEMREDRDDDCGIFNACPEPAEGTAMIFSVPPQCGQCSISIWKEHLSYCTSCSGIVRGPWSDVLAGDGELVGKPV